MHDNALIQHDDAEGTCAESEEMSDSAEPVVRHFRQIVVWPLQLITKNGDDGYHLLEKMGDAPWKAQGDKFGLDDELFGERHYREFISFLPHMQRFLYGDSHAEGNTHGNGDISMRVFQRNDIKQVRVTLDIDTTPVTCDVVHTSLLFFYDVDAVALVCEIAANEIPLSTAQKLMQRFGRAYPAGWHEDGWPIHCPVLVEWLGKEGHVLSTSDYHNRPRFLQFVDERRAACIASHWEYMLHPLVNDADPAPGKLRLREIEYYRMPVMTYLTLDDLDALTKADYIALSLATAPASNDKLPFSDQFLKKFEAKHYYERRYAGGLDAPQLDTRFLTCGEAFTIVSAGVSEGMKDDERGLLSQFRHQYFLLFLIAHFHKSALLMIADRMAGSIKKFDPLDADSRQAFRHATFKLQEAFLRFSQRYFFTEISGRTHIRDMFHMVRNHLDIQRLYTETREELTDMVHYLDSNTLRRQSGSMHRLTVVTIVGMVGTISTGFLGMNLIAAADEVFSLKTLYFGAVTLLAAGLTALSIVYSGPLGRLFARLSGDTRKD
jgi:hypothetical protein